MRAIAPSFSRLRREAESGTAEEAPIPMLSRHRMAVTQIRRVVEKVSREQPGEWATICDGRIALGRELLARATRLEAAGGPKRVQLASEVRQEGRAELERADAEAEAQGSPGITW